MEEDKKNESKSSFETPSISGQDQRGAAKDQDCQRLSSERDPEGFGACKMGSLTGRKEKLLPAGSGRGGAGTVLSDSLSFLGDV